MVTLWRAQPIVTDVSSRGGQGWTWLLSPIAPPLRITALFLLLIPNNHSPPCTVCVRADRGGHDPDLTPHVIDVAAYLLSLPPRLRSGSLLTNAPSVHNQSSLPAHRHPHTHRPDRPDIAAAAHLGTRPSLAADLHVWGPIGQPAWEEDPRTQPPLNKWML